MTFKSIAVVTLIDGNQSINQSNSQSLADVKLGAHRILIHQEQKICVRKIVSANFFLTFNITRSQTN